MNKCCGLVGKIFGHCFRSLVTEHIAPSPEQITAATAASNKDWFLPSYQPEVLAGLASEKYTIVCKRCGGFYDKI